MGKERCVSSLDSLISLVGEGGKGGVVCGRIKFVNYSYPSFQHSLYPFSILTMKSPSTRATDL